MTLKKLNLPQQFVLPDYQGHTIANIPGTVAALLGVPFDGLPALEERLWQPLAGQARRIIVLLVDAFGWNLFQQEQSRLQWLMDRTAVQGKITSVFPSTTVAALSSLWTGYAPAQHGLIGLRLFFPQYGVLGQLIKFTPNFKSFPGALVDAGLEPVEFLQVPGFAEQLAAAGIDSHSFKGREIVHSALSEMHDRGVAGRHGFLTVSDMFVQLRHLLEETAGSPLYINAYWPAVDLLSHVYGPHHPSVAAELHAVLDQLKKELLDQLSPAARRDTVLFIVGDHGQATTTPEEHVQLSRHPELKEKLLMRPAGEPRTAYLYAKQGQKAAVQHYLETKLSGSMATMDAAEALAAGLFGPPPHAATALDHLGDLVTTMLTGHLLLTDEEVAKSAWMIGRHGGMTAAEMEVPWLGIDLAA